MYLHYVFEFEKINVENRKASPIFLLNTRSLPPSSSKPVSLQSTVSKSPHLHSSTACRENIRPPEIANFVAHK